jgi:broad specificity phosphatase PhoE
MTILVRPFLSVCLGLFSSLALAATPDHLADALASGHYVLMMRHAEAPGTGDPAGYSLEDCSTQRNVGEGGRRQAVSTGEWLRRQGITRTMLYSSPWCRCKDTAQSLNLGDYVVEPALGSFFDSPRRARLQTQALSAFIARILAVKGPHAVILVTHHVNIREFVGENIGSGDMVLVRVGLDGQYISHRLISSPGGHQSVTP